MKTRLPTWLKVEINVSTILLAMLGGFITYIAIPWCTFVQSSISELKTDVAVIKRVVAPDHAVSKDGKIVVTRLKD